MSELHLSLIIIGLVFIAAVFLFNRWQERKYRRQTEKMFRGERQDVLFDEAPNKVNPEDHEPKGRIEPSFSASPSAASATPASQMPKKPSPAHSAPENLSSGGLPSRNPPLGRKEPPLRSVGKPASAVPLASIPGRTEPPVAPASTVHETEPDGVIDEAIDLIGTISLAKSVTGNSVKSLLVRSQTFGMPVHWEGLDDAGQWTEIAPAGHYRDLKSALQLADRRGTASGADVSRFIALIKQFAMELSGTAQMEAEDSATIRATELDAFCAEVDVEIGVNLIASERAIAGTKLRALAEASGMKLNADGVFHFVDEHGASLFTLRNSEPRPLLPDHVKNITTHGITLLLDVPRVAHGVQAFDQMLKLGRHIADSLGGEVVDDNRKPLTDAGADSIRRQLRMIYQQMDGYGIPAGSALALRLFS